MIKTIDLTTKVTFGSHGKGTLVIGSDYGLITIQELTHEMNIGDEVKEGDYVDLPKVLLLFNDTKSIDVLIEKLERVKTLMEKYTYCLAC